MFMVIVSRTLNWIPPLYLQRFPAVLLLELNGTPTAQLDIVLLQTNA